MSAIKGLERGTNATATKTVTHTKIALALTFLGFAAFAAGLAGTRVQAISDSRKPDLEISRIVFNANDDLMLTEDANGDAVYFSQKEDQDRVSIFYRNIGETSTEKPFSIKVTFNPAPYIEGVVAQLKPVDTTSTVIFEEVDDNDTGTYVFDVDSEESASPYIKNLNTYVLAKRQEGRIELVIPKYYRQMLGNGMLSIKAVVDEGKESEAIIEYNEGNNDAVKYVLFSEVEERTGNACTINETEVGLNPVLEDCKANGFAYACIDRYTFSFKGCVNDAAECAQDPGDTQACETRIETAERPLLQNMKVTIVGDIYSVNASKRSAYFRPDLSFVYDLTNVQQLTKATLTADQVTENTQYGFVISEKPLDLSADISSIAPKITWKEKPVHEFRTGFSSYTLYAFIRNNDGKGALLETNMIDVDDVILGRFVAE